MEERLDTDAQLVGATLGDTVALFNMRAAIVTSGGDRPIDVKLSALVLNGRTLTGYGPDPKWLVFQQDVTSGLGYENIPLPANPQPVEVFGELIPGTHTVQLRFGDTFAIVVLADPAQGIAECHIAARELPTWLAEKTLQYWPDGRFPELYEVNTSDKRLIS
jgi:hypothetical protein